MNRWRHETVETQQVSSYVPLSLWVRSAYKRYESNFRMQTISEASDEAVYSAGAVAGFCLDSDLRQQGGSTAGILRALLKRTRPDGVISDETFINEIRRVSPASADRFYRLINQRKFDFSACMLRALENAERRGRG